MVGLSKELWGQGLMPEAVAEVIRFLFVEIGLDVIFADIFLATSSQRGYRKNAVSGIMLLTPSRRKWVQRKKTRSAFIQRKTG